MKKIIDKDGRLFGLISVLDVLVVAVAAVLIFALQTKETAMPIASVDDPLDTITYRVVITDMPVGRWESMRIGDQLFDRETFNYVGTIEGMEVIAPVEDKLDVAIVVKADALVDARGHYYINRNTFIATGWGMQLYTMTTLFNGTVMEIETV